MVTLVVCAKIADELKNLSDTNTNISYLILLFILNISFLILLLLFSVNIPFPNGIDGSFVREFKYNSISNNDVISAFV